MSKNEKDPIKDKEATLTKLAKIILTCPNFFDFDWCQDHCPLLYKFCDNISEALRSTEGSPRIA